MSGSSNIIAAAAAVIITSVSNNSNISNSSSISSISSNISSSNISSSGNITSAATSTDDDSNFTEIITGGDPFNLQSPIVTSMILYLITAMVAFMEYYHSLASSPSTSSAALQQSNSNSATGNSHSHSHSHSHTQLHPSDDTRLGSSSKLGAGAGTGTSTSTGNNISGRNRVSRRGEFNNSSVDINPSGTDGNNTSNGASGTGTAVDMKSPGEENRRLFYKYLSISLVLRLILLPVQQTFTNEIIRKEHRHDTNTEDDIVNTDINDDNNITITVAQSLPILTSMISYTILICFYAQVTFIATGRIQNMQIIQKLKQSFVQVVYGIYACIIFFNSVIPTISNVWLDILIWTMMCLYHLCLCCSMAYFGSSLTSILKSNLAGGLGVRLVSMSIICAAMFFLRFMLEGFKVVNTVNGFVIQRQEREYSYSQYTYHDENVILIPIHLDFGTWDTSFGRDVMGYIILEWLPAVLVLAMMHRASSRNNNNGDSGSGSGNNGNGNGRGSRIGGVGVGVDDTMNALEGGQYSPILDPPIDVKPKSGLMGMGGGVKRSFSANGGIPITTRTALHQHQQASTGQRAVAGSFGMLRTGSGGRGGSGGETASLLGEKSSSAFASSSIPAQSYGAATYTDD